MMDLSMDTILHDVRYGARRLARSPGFTLIAVAALALGIGANTAIFSVTNAVLLQPLPFREQARLVWVWERDLRTDRPRSSVSPVSLTAFRDETGVFEGIGSSYDEMYNLTGAGEPETIIAYRFSHNFFAVLGTPPLLGRTFLPEEDQPGHDRVVVLSHKLWTRHFDADPGVVGRSITLDGNSYTVVGVMPPGFQHPVMAELWTPIALTPEQAATPEPRFLRLVARLRPGVSLREAQTAVDRVSARLARERKDTHGQWGAVVSPIESRYTGDIKPALLALVGAVGFVLLIACANVANLLLARGASRRRELALRAALGASRLRVVRQLLVESTLLALAGGAAGTLFASWSLGFLLGLFPKAVANVAIPRLDQIHLDATVFGFTLLLSLATGILFGLVPALTVSRLELSEALQQGVKGAGGPQGGRRLRNALVVAEVALALVLVTGGALMIRSFLNLQSGELGFDTRNVLTARLVLPSYKYGDAAKRQAFVDQVTARIRSLPGVEAVGTTPFLPLSGWSSGRSFLIQGEPAPGPGREPQAEIRIVNEDYFRALRIPLARGRVFAETDRIDSPKVVIVNETLARRFFPGQDPIGRRIRVQSFGPEVPADDPSQWLEVVGIARDVRHYGLARPPEPELYFPYRQGPMDLVCLAVRTTQDPEALGKSLREAVWAIDADQPVLGLMSLERLAAESVTLQRVSTHLIGFFAAVALLLAALGIYGVMAYAVTQRIPEIGVRVALGASARQVLGLVLREGMGLAALGAAVGLAASLALTRLLSSLLFGISATDPASFAGVLLLVATAAFLACFIPARRAMRVDPMVALRYE
jgi:putative ABC transport system permease protein